MISVPVSITLMRWKQKHFMCVSVLKKKSCLIIYIFKKDYQYSLLIYALNTNRQVHATLTNTLTCRHSLTHTHWPYSDITRVELKDLMLHFLCVSVCVCVTTEGMPWLRSWLRVMENSTNFQTNTLETIKREKHGRT